MADHEAGAPRRLELPAQLANGTAIGERREHDLLVSRWLEREDALAAGAQVELAPLAQRTPDVADGMARLHRVHGPEPATRGIVERQHEGLVEGLRRDLHHRPRHRPDIQAFREQQREARQRRAHPEPAA